MEGRRPGGVSRGSWRTKQEESSSEFLQPDAWPVEAAHLAPALRGLGPPYCLPRVHLKPGTPPRSSPALVWAQECGDNWISVYKDGGCSSLPRTSCSKRLLRRQRSASDGEKHRITEVEVDPQIELRETELSPPRWPRPLLVTKEQLLIERLRNQALHRSLLSLSSFSSSQTSSSSPSSDSLPSCSCCLATVRASNVADPTSPSAFTEVTPSRPRKQRRCGCNWWTLILLCSSSLIMLALGLLYLCETTHMMEHGVADY